MRAFSIIISVVLTSVLVACLDSTTDVTAEITKEKPLNTTLVTYLKTIENHRKKADRYMSNPKKSPLEKDSIETFTGLNYYPISENWNIHASYIKIDTGTIFQMPTSTERLIPMIKHGLIQFVKDGDTIQLFAYRYIEYPEEDLFVPFLDATNGDETYGGGRYIEVPFPKENSIWIDFNKAYNPYCAYNHDYSCPIPPLENTLKVGVNSGEKVLYAY